MTKEEMLLKVKSNLKLNDDTQDLAISDVIQDTCTYCNLQNRLPEEMEPIIRRKVKAIMDYEAANGAGYAKEIQSIKEGDGIHYLCPDRRKYPCYHLWFRQGRQGSAEAVQEVKRLWLTRMQ